MPVPMRPFGRTGLQVPLLGFGALQLGDPALDPGQRTAIQAVYAANAGDWEGLV